MSETGVAVVITAATSTQNKAERNTAWCRQRLGAIRTGSIQRLRIYFPCMWLQDKKKILEKIHIYAHIWSLVNYLFSKRLCKDLVDFISHRGLFKRLLCIRNPGLQLVSGKECPPCLEKRAPGLFTALTETQQRSAARDAWGQAEMFPSSICNSIPQFPLWNNSLNSELFFFLIHHIIHLPSSIKKQSVSNFGSKLLFFGKAQFSSAPNKKWLNYMHHMRHWCTHNAPPP